MHQPTRHRQKNEKQKAAIRGRLDAGVLWSLFFYPVICHYLLFDFFTCSYAFIL
jgi:hypothetical protein